ncbi:MAG: ATP phosphoribosyltransferase regulatory subunit, partial [Sphingomonas sp.]
DPRLVRGLDYYRHVTFEYVTEELGAQSQVIGGGRYDGLIENMGGPSTPAVGWAAGIERLAMMLDQPGTSGLDVIIALEDDRALGDAQRSLKLLREDGLSADMIATGSPRKRYDKATKIAAKVLVAIQWRDDKAVANIRSTLETPEQQRVHELLERLKA